MSKPIQAYPSVSSSLSSLPRVKTMSDVSLHHHMYAQQAQDGQRKLQQALGKPPPSQSPLPPCPPSPYPPTTTPPITMRQKSKFDAGGVGGAFQDSSIDGGSNDGERLKERMIAAESAMTLVQNHHAGYPLQRLLPARILDELLRIIRCTLGKRDVMACRTSSFSLVSASSADSTCKKCAPRDSSDQCACIGASESAEGRAVATGSSSRTSWARNERLEAKLRRGSGDRGEIKAGLPEADDAWRTVSAVRSQAAALLGAETDQPFLSPYSPHANGVHDPECCRETTYSPSRISTSRCSRILRRWTRDLRRVAGQRDAHVTSLLWLERRHVMTSASVSFHTHLWVAAARRPLKLRNENQAHHIQHRGFAIRVRVARSLRALEPLNPPERPTRGPNCGSPGNCRAVVDMVIEGLDGASQASAMSLYIGGQGLVRPEKHRAAFAVARLPLRYCGRMACGGYLSPTFEGAEEQASASFDLSFLPYLSFSISQGSTMKFFAIFTLALLAVPVASNNILDSHRRRSARAKQRLAEKQLDAVELTIEYEDANAHHTTSPSTVTAIATMTPDRSGNGLAAFAADPSINAAGIYAAAQRSQGRLLETYPTSPDRKIYSNIYGDWLNLTGVSAFHFIADMDVDCDGPMANCQGNRDGQTETSFGALDATKTMLMDNALGAIICNGKMVYGIYGDQDADSPEVIGEASILIAQTCFGSTVNGNSGHAAADVAYIVFGNKVPGGVGKTNIDISALKTLGDVSARALQKALGL
uniref:Endo-chitosanase n=1 Tax=Mycena chlorophos TaxID=658473 RepID=A0ABQ0LKV9_MYCCL|nr:predicted protein [Mycena chlorophos]